MTVDNSIEQFVENIEFDMLMALACLLHIGRDVAHVPDWLDDEWPDREDKLRVAVAEAMMKVGQK